jgi:hypothetical protein
MGYSTKHGWQRFACCTAIIAVSGAVNAEMCKWLDEDGTVNYAESCPENVESVKVEIQPPPSQSQVAEAEQQSVEYRKVLNDRKSPRTLAGKSRSLTLKELGSLPENTTSTYLVTKGTGIGLDEDDKGQFSLFLKARDSLPRGAYLEVHFPVPGNEGQKQIIEKSSVSKGSSFLMVSAKSSGFKCWNYQVEVHVYADDSKEELLDIHQQTIQSRFDQDLFKGLVEHLEGMAGGGICPSGDKRDMKKMSAEQLDALCESVREKHLRPERDKLIARCIKRGEKQDEWCVNYYADWGDAQRIDTAHIRPAMYYNLPECVAAKEAREKANNVR